MAQHGSDTRSCSNDDKTVEQCGNAHNTASRKTTDPDVCGGVLNTRLGPIASIRYHERVTCRNTFFEVGLMGWDRRKGVPFNEGAVGDACKATVDRDGIVKV